MKAYIKNGLVHKTKTPNGGEFDLEKYFKQVLTKFGIQFADPCCSNAVAINATATATVQQITSGTITSTSAAPTTITTPTATEIATAKNATQGTVMYFNVDNSAGASTVTLALGTGITIITGTVLTVVSGAVATFKLYFTSATTAKIARVM